MLCFVNGVFPKWTCQLYYFWRATRIILRNTIIALKYVITFFLFFTISITSPAIEVDSLEKLLPISVGKEKVDLLNKLSWELKFSNPDKAIQYAIASQNLSDSIAYESGLGKALETLAVIYSIASNYELSNQYANQAIAQYKQNENIIGIAKCWNVLGLNQNNIGNYKKALFYLNNSLEQFQTVNNEEYILKLEANIGNIHYYIGNYDTALIAYNKIVELARKSQDYDMLVDNLANVGLIYSSYGNFAKALQFIYEVLDLAKEKKDSSRLAMHLNTASTIFNQLEMADESIHEVKKAIKLNQLLKNEQRLGMNYNSIANAFKRKNQDDSAYYYYKSALKSYAKVGVVAKGNLYINLGSLHLKSSNLDSATYYLKKGLELSSNLNRKEGIARAKSILSKVYIIQKRYDEAIQLLEESIGYWQKSKVYDELSSSAKILAEVYREIGKNDSLIRYQLLYNEANDSVNGREKQIALTRLLVRQNLKKQLSLEKPEVQIDERTKPYYLYALLIVLAIGLVYLIYLITIGKKNVNILQLKLHQKEKELAFFSLSTIQKDKLIKDFADTLLTYKSKYPENESIQKLLISYKVDDIESNSWEQFKNTFQQIAPDFFDKLLKKCPSLTDREMRVCALIRLNVPVKEMAKILAISIDSVNMARYRLRKRLDLSGKRSLETFLLSL